MRMSRKRRRKVQERRRIAGDVSDALSKGAYLAVGAMFLYNAANPAFLYAMPSGGQVAAGQAAIHQAGTTMTIQQQTAQAILNWRSFGILPNEQVNFLQPGRNSVALNRVLGNDPSAIYGKLTSNGRVFLVNPNGVFFAPGAQVNVGGLVATTLSITDADFMAGHYRFKNGGNAKGVVNQGTIAAKEQGLVALLAPEVKNEGLIVAKKGTVAMAAGEQMTLDYAGDGKIQLAVTQGARQATVENKGMVEADGGIVLMTARGNQDLTSSAVNQSGIVRARRLDGKTGAVTIDAYGGAAHVNGTVDVSGADARGGTVDVFGKDITLGGAAKIDASGQGGGTVRVGGDWQGAGAAPHADRVTMEKGAVIRADAIQNGDGGKVVLWSDGTTKFAGAITAKGGAISGDGGKVETSGRVLKASGDVNASALHGQAGEWLLDPGSITITSPGDSLNSDGSFTGGDANSSVDVNSITNALNASTGSTNVNIKTGADGDITVDAAIDKTAGGNATLTLDAGGSIYVNQAITSGSNALDVKLLADNDGKSGGRIEVNAAITTNGGSVTLRGGAGGKGYAVSNTSAAGVTVAGAIDAGAGNITIAGQSTQGNGVDITGKLSSGGTIEITGDGASGGKGISLGAVDGKNVTLIGDSMAFNGAVTGTGAGTATIKRIKEGAISLGSGASDGLALNDIGKLTGFGSYLLGGQNVTGVTVTGAAAFDGDTTLETKGGVTVSGALNAGAKKVTLKAGADSGGSGAITAGALDLQGADANFRFTSANAVDALTGKVKSVTFVNGKDFAIGAAGLTSANGAVDLTAQGKLTLGGEIHAGSGDITLKMNELDGSGKSGGWVKGTGKLTIDRATGGAISLGGVSGSGLHLASADFGSGNTLFGSGFGKGVFIGGTNASNVAIHGAFTVNDALTVTSTGAMDFGSGGVVKTGNNKDLTLTAGAITFAGNNGLGAGTGTLTMNTDSVTGWSHLTFDDAKKGGSLVIAPKSQGAKLYIGDVSESDQLAITRDALNGIAAANFKNVRLGYGAADGTNRGTGDVYLHGGLLPKTNLTINGGKGYFQSGTLSNDKDYTLTFNLDSLEQTAGTIFDLGGNLALNGTGAFILNSTGNVSLGNLTAKNIGSLDVYSRSLGVGGEGITSGGNITFTTDKITDVLGQVKSTGGDILLHTITTTKDINIGAGAGGLDLSAAWMEKFLATGKDKTFTIGDANYTGTIWIADTKFGSTLKLLTKKDSGGGKVKLTGNVWSGLSGDKDMWITSWSWAWTGATLHVKDLWLDIGEGLSKGGEVKSSGGEVHFTKPSGKDLYITNQSSDVASGGYQIAYDFLNGMTGFENFAIEGDQNVYLFGGALNQSVDISAKDDSAYGMTIQGPVTINGTDKKVNLTGNTITLESGASVAVGSNALTLTADTLTDNTSGTISGTGALTVQQRTAGTALTIGSGGGGLHFTEEQLNGGLFGNGFGSLTLGSETGGDVTTDTNLTLNNNLTIQAGSGSKIQLGGDLTIGGADDTYKVTLKGGTIDNQGHTINANKGTLNLYGNTFNLTGSGAVKGSGMLGIGAYDDNGTISLGDTAHGGLHLKNDFFATVFDGFDRYKIGNGGTAQTISVDDASLTKNTILDANAVMFKGGGMTMGGGTTLTLRSQNVKQETGANLTVSNLSLQGGDTGSFNLLNAGNAIAGTVSGEGHRMQIAAGKLTVGTITGKGDAKTGLIELASDEIGFKGGAGSVTGGGELYLHQNSGNGLYLGAATGSAPGLTLKNEVFKSLGTGFTQVSLGYKDGKGLITAGGDLGFNNHTAIYGTKITTNADTKLTTGGKNLTLVADQLDLQGNIAGSGGSLTLQTLTKGRDLSLGQSEHGAAGSTLFLKSGYFDGSGGVPQVFTGNYGTIYLGRTDGTGTLYQTGSTTFTDNVVVLQGSESGSTTGYYASGDIKTGGKNFTVESLKATFDNAHVDSGKGSISIKTDTLEIQNGSTFKGSGGLVLDAYTNTKSITLGSGGSGLNLDTDWFGAGGAFAGVTGGIQIGSKENTGGIVVGQDVVIQNNHLTLATGGAVSGGGAISLTGGDKNLVVDGDQNVALSGALTGVGTLTATSKNGGITFSGGGNQISNLGDITAKKNVEIKNQSALTITGTVTGAKDSDKGKDAVAITTGGGNLTIAAGGKVQSTNGNVTLTANGVNGHFINRGGKDAIQTTGSNSRWLVYTWDSLGDDFGGLTGDFRKYGASSATDGLIPTTGNGSAHFYKPKVTVYAEKTYGDGNTQFFENGTFRLIVEGGKAREDADKVFMGVNELLSGQTLSASYSYGNAIDKDNGKSLDVNKNIGGKGQNAAKSYGSDYDTGADMQNYEIAYKQDQNSMNYDVSVEFWVKPKQASVGANNDTVDYGQLGSNGYQGNAAHPNGAWNGTGGNGWGPVGGLVNGQQIQWDGAQGKFVVSGGSVAGFDGNVNGYTGSSQGALAPGDYQIGLVGDLYADNYIFTYLPGKLTITDHNGSYVPPTPPYPAPNDPITGAVGTVNQAAQSKPADPFMARPDAARGKARRAQLPPLMGDIDPKVPAMNMDGMVNIIDVITTADYPKGNLDVRVQGRTGAYRLYADRDGFGMLLNDGAEGYDPEHSRTDGAIPVLYTDYSSVGTDDEQSLDGFYAVAYTPEKLSIQPAAQGAKAPRRSELKPDLRLDYGVTYEDAGLGVFQAAIGDGIVTIHPKDDAALHTVTNAAKAAQRAVLTAGVLRAIRDFGVTPDQLRAIYIFREKLPLPKEARKG